jgi:hypothetical protein
MILGAMDQKLWMFEVFGQGLARAGMCWSQLARIDHMRKKWSVEGKTNSKIKEQFGQGQASTRGQRLTVARWPRVDA